MTKSVSNCSELSAASNCCAKIYILTTKSQIETSTRRCLILIIVASLAQSHKLLPIYLIIKTKNIGSFVYMVWYIFTKHGVLYYNKGNL